MPDRSVPYPLRPADEAMLRSLILHRDEAVIVLNNRRGLRLRAAM